MEINFENLGMSNFFQKYRNLSLRDWDKEYKKSIYSVSFLTVYMKSCINLSIKIQVIDN